MLQRPGKSLWEHGKKKRSSFLAAVYFLQDFLVFIYLFIFWGVVCHWYITACGASGLVCLFIMGCLILEQEAELRVKMFRQGRTLPPSGRRYAYS